MHTVQELGQVFLKAVKKCNGNALVTQGLYDPEDL